MQTGTRSNQEGKKKSHCLQTSRSVHFHSLMQAYHVASVPALQEAPLNSVDVYSWLWLELQRIVRRGCFPHLCHPFTIWAREQALHCRHPELRDMSLHVHWLSLAWLQATCTHGRCVIHSPETTLCLFARCQENSEALTSLYPDAINTSNSC